MSLDYIRRQYKVDASKGVRVRYKGKHLGTITGSRGPHILVKMDGESWSEVYHPTWEMEYLTAELEAGAGSGDNEVTNPQSGASL